MIRTLPHSAGWRPAPRRYLPAPARLPPRSSQRACRWATFVDDTIAIVVHPVTRLGCGPALRTAVVDLAVTVVVDSVADFRPTWIQLAALVNHSVAVVVDPVYDLRRRNAVWTCAGLARCPQEKDEQTDGAHRCQRRNTPAESHEPSSSMMPSQSLSMPSHSSGSGMQQSSSTTPSQSLSIPSHHSGSQPAGTGKVHASPTPSPSTSC